MEKLDMWVVLRTAADLAARIPEHLADEALTLETIRYVSADGRREIHQRFRELEQLGLVKHDRFIDDHGAVQRSVWLVTPAGFAECARRRAQEES